MNSKHGKATEAATSDLGQGLILSFEGSLASEHRKKALSEYGDLIEKAFDKAVHRLTALVST